MAVLQDRPALQVTCLACGWISSTGDPIHTVCVCGGRSFSWDDGLEDPKQRKALARGARVAWGARVNDG